METSDRYAAEQFGAPCCPVLPRLVRVWFGQEDEALAAFDAVIALDPDYTAAHVQKAHLLIKAGRREDARAVIDGLNVTSASNTLKEAIPGVTLELKGTDSAATTLTVADHPNWSLVLYNPKPNTDTDERLARLPRLRLTESA